MQHKVSALHHNTLPYTTPHQATFGHHTHTTYLSTLHYRIIRYTAPRYVTPHHSKLNYITLDRKLHHTTPHYPAYVALIKKITALHETTRQKNKSVCLNTTLRYATMHCISVFCTVHHCTVISAMQLIT